MSASLNRFSVLPASPLPPGFAGGELDYLANGSLARGTVVIVPLGPRKVPGVVVGPGRGGVDSEKLRSIIATPGIPPLTEAQLDWLRRVAEWTLAPHGAVLKMMLPSADFLEPVAPLVGLVAAADIADKMPAKRRAVLEAATVPLTRAALARTAGVSAALVKRMADDGLLREEVMASDAALPDPAHGGITLNDEQQAAAEHLKGAVAGREFAPFLLDGVTGSGKTEVYFEAIAEVLRQGRKALILLPEIALTPASRERIAQRFGAEPLVWHSSIASGERHKAFRAITDAGPRIIIGARSALFLPYADLGVIIVDEEHDTGYKQDDNVVYHARDMAVMRARAENIPVVLVSATPSLESEVNVERGRYARLELTRRASDALMPRIELVDVTKHPPERGQWITPPLAQAITETLARNKQVMLFLNRRGYAPVTVCRKCGEKVSCPNCAAWLVTHRNSGRLQCHHCGHWSSFPKTCPSCGATSDDGSHMVPCGPGVERLSEEVGKRFPDARHMVLSSDTITNTAALARMMEEIGTGKTDIIIGTQIVAKGHHFPRLALVGVVDADLGLAGGDLRAAETTWQLMTQVAGRAGREDGDEAALAMLQTTSPDVAVLQYLMAGDREGFIAHEKAARERAGMPPFGRLAAIGLTATTKAAVDEAGAALRAKAPAFEGVTILGPAPAPIAFLRGRHRVRFIVRTARDVDIQTIITGWTGGIKLKSGVRMQIDIDPYQFI